MTETSLFANLVIVKFGWEIVANIFSLIVTGCPVRHSPDFHRGVYIRCSVLWPRCQDPAWLSRRAAEKKWSKKNMNRCTCSAKEISKIFKLQNAIFVSNIVKFRIGLKYSYWRVTASQDLVAFSFTVINFLAFLFSKRLWNNRGKTPLHGPR